MKMKTLKDCHKSSKTFKLQDNIKCKKIHSALSGLDFWDMYQGLVAFKIKIFVSEFLTIHLFSIIK